MPRTTNSRSCRRSRRSATSGATRYNWDGLNVLLERDAGDTTTATHTHGPVAIPGIGTHITTRQHDGTPADIWYEHDAIGSTRQLTDESDPPEITRRNLLDAWGNLLATAGTQDTPYVFTGKETDPDTGLIYFGRRFYDPTIARWINRDPARDGLNWYQYAGNNPVGTVDPGGLQDFPMHPLLKGRLESELEGIVAETRRWLQRIRNTLMTPVDKFAMRKNPYGTIRPGLALQTETVGRVSVRGQLRDYPDYLSAARSSVELAEALGAMSLQWLPEGHHTWVRVEDIWVAEIESGDGLTLENLNEAGQVILIDAKLLRTACGRTRPQWAAQLGITILEEQWHSFWNTTRVNEWRSTALEEEWVDRWITHVVEGNLQKAEGTQFGLHWYPHPTEGHVLCRDLLDRIAADRGLECFAPRARPATTPSFPPEHPLTQGTGTARARRELFRANPGAIRGFAQPSRLRKP